MKKNITYNKKKKCYFLNKEEMTVGMIIEVYDKRNWLKGRVNYNKNWHTGFYLIALDHQDKDMEDIPLYDKKIGRMVT